MTADLSRVSHTSLTWYCKVRYLLEASSLVSSLSFQGPRPPGRHSLLSSFPASLPPLSTSFANEFAPFILLLTFLPLHGSQNLLCTSCGRESVSPRHGSHFITSFPATPSLWLRSHSSLTLLPYPLLLLIPSIDLLDLNKGEKQPFESCDSRDTLTSASSFLYAALPAISS